MPCGATSPRVFDFIASYGSRGRCSRWPFVAVGIGRSSRSAENVEEDTLNDDDDREPYAQTVDKHHGSNSAMRIWASCHRVPVLYSAASPTKCGPWSKASGRNSCTSCRQKGAGLSVGFALPFQIFRLPGRRGIE